MSKIHMDKNSIQMSFSEKISIQSVEEFEKTKVEQSIIDITLETINSLITRVERLIADNEPIVILSKGHLLTMRKLIQLIDKAKYNDMAKIYYLFEGYDINQLRFFEKNAVNFTERFASMLESYKLKIRTSVIIDPIITIDVFKLIKMVWQWVTDEIHLGIKDPKDFYIPLEPIEQKEKTYLEEIEKIRTPQFLNQLYVDIRRLEEKCGICKIIWKDSIRSIIQINQEIDNNIIMAEIQNY